MKNVNQWAEACYSNASMKKVFGTVQMCAKPQANCCRPKEGRKAKGCRRCCTKAKGRKEIGQC